MAKADKKLFQDILQDRADLKAQTDASMKTATDLVAATDKAYSDQLGVKTPVHPKDKQNIQGAEKDKPVNIERVQNLTKLLQEQKEKDSKLPIKTLNVNA
jgi:hypothetical protein